MSLSAAYCAGLFDGEGYVRIDVYKFPSPRKSTRYQLTAGIGMCHWPTIKALHDQFGGTLFKNTSAHKRDPKNRMQYHWLIASGAARDFLALIAPHSITKRDEIVLAIRFQRHLDRYCAKMQGGARRYDDEHNRLRRRVFAFRQHLADRIKGLKKVSYDVEVTGDPLVNGGAVQS